MLGIPGDELKAAAQHVDRTLSEADRVLVEARAALAEGRPGIRHLAAIAEDIHAITTRLRDVFTGKPKA